MTRTDRELDAPAPSATRRGLLRWGAGGGAAIAGAALLGGLHSGAAAAQQAEPLVGTWIIAVTGTSDPNERDLVSFTSDGIMLATNTPYSPPDPTQGADATATYTTGGYGVWTKTGAGQYRAAFVSIDTGTDGMFQDMSKVSVKLALSADGNSLTGSYGVEVRDAAGNVLFAPPGDLGTVQGTRITV